MKSLLFFMFMSILLVTACEQDTGYGEEAVSFDSSTVGLNQSDPDVIAEWIEYLESSDDGAWEDVDDCSVKYRYLGHLYDDTELDIPVYSPFAVSCYSDTVYVTDASTRQVIALDEAGCVLWKAGGPGEGPGHFGQMTTLAASRLYVAVLNKSLRRIELFSRGGSFSHSLQFVRAQDIVALDDTTFIVASSEESGGDIHILDSDSGIVRSFGEAEMHHYESILRPDLMRLCLGPDNRVALFNRYEGLLVIYDIDSEECIYRGSREYPSTPTPPEEYVDSNGERRTLNYPIGGNAFRGPDGMLNVVVCNYMDDGSFISDLDYLDFAPITAVDRYDWDGNYLDSYCLPDSCINFVAMLPDGHLVARNFAEGILCHFKML